MKLGLSILLIFVLQGCAHQPLSLRSDVEADYLEVCIAFATGMEMEDKLLHLDAVNSFIDEYNAQDSRFYDLRACSEKKESHSEFWDEVKTEGTQDKTLIGNLPLNHEHENVESETAENMLKMERQVRLTIQNTRYVPPSEQALYVIVSGAGIYSLMNAGFGLVWAGFNTTTLGVNLSSDLTDERNTVYRQFSSSPYFYDLPRVKQKHMKRFQLFLFELFAEISQLDEKNDVIEQQMKVEN